MATKRNKENQLEDEVTASVTGTNLAFPAAVCLAADTTDWVKKGLNGHLGYAREKENKAAVTFLPKLKLTTTASRSTSV